MPTVQWLSNCCSLSSPSLWISIPYSHSLLHLLQCWLIKFTPKLTHTHADNLQAQFPLTPCRPLSPSLTLSISLVNCLSTFHLLTWIWIEVDWWCCCRNITSTPPHTHTHAHGHTHTTVTSCRKMKIIYLLKSPGQTLICSRKNKAPQLTVKQANIQK